MRDFGIKVFHARKNMIKQHFQFSPNFHEKLAIFHLVSKIVEFSVRI